MMWMMIVLTNGNLSNPHTHTHTHTHTPHTHTHTQFERKEKGVQTAEYALAVVRNPLLLPQQVIWEHTKELCAAPQHEDSCLVCGTLTEWQRVADHHKLC